MLNGSSERPHSLASSGLGPSSMREDSSTDPLGGMGHYPQHAQKFFMLYEFGCFERPPTGFEILPRSRCLLDVDSECGASQARACG